MQLSWPWPVSTGQAFGLKTTIKPNAKTTLFVHSSNIQSSMYAPISGMNKSVHDDGAVKKYALFYTFFYL